MFHKTHSQIFNTGTVYEVEYTQTQINTQTNRHSDRETEIYVTRCSAITERLRCSVG